MAGLAQGPGGGVVDVVVVRRVGHAGVVAAEAGGNEGPVGVGIGVGD